MCHWKKGDVFFTLKDETQRQQSFWFCDTKRQRVKAELPEQAGISVHQTCAEFVNTSLTSAGEQCWEPREPLQWLNILLNLPIQGLPIPQNPLPGEHQQEVDYIWRPFLRQENKILHIKLIHHLCKEKGTAASKIRVLSQLWSGALLGMHHLEKLKV